MDIKSTVFKNIKIRVNKAYKFSYIKQKGYALMLLINGKAEVEKENGVFNWKEGDIMLMSPEELAFVSSDKQIEYLSFTVDAEAFKKLSMKKDRWKIVFKHDYINNEDPHYFELFLNLTILYKVWNTTSKHGIRESFERENQVIEHLLSSMTDLKRQIPGIGSIPAGTENLLDSIVNYISFSEENFTLKSLSKKFTISENYLSKIFNEYTGMKYVEFRNKICLSRSIEMFEAGKSMMEIGQEAGFSSGKVMNRTFKRYLNTSPSKFKKEILRLRSGLNEGAEHSDTGYVNSEDGISGINIFKRNILIDEKSSKNLMKGPNGGSSRFDFKNISGLKSIKDILDFGNWQEYVGIIKPKEINFSLDRIDGEYYVRIVKRRLEYNENTLLRIAEVLKAYERRCEINIRFNFFQKEEYEEKSDGFRHLLDEHKLIVQDLIESMKIMGVLTEIDKLSFELNIENAVCSIDSLSVKRNLKEYREELFEIIEEGLVGIEFKKGVYIGEISTPEENFKELIRNLEDIDKISFKTNNFDNTYTFKNIFEQIEDIAEHVRARIETAKTIYIGKFPKIYMDEIQLYTNLNEIPQLYRKLFDCTVILKAVQQFIYITNTIDMIYIIDTASMSREAIQFIFMVCFWYNWSKIPCFNLLLNLPRLKSRGSKN